MIKFQNMGLQKLVFFDGITKLHILKAFLSLHIGIFYVIKCFLIDTNTSKCCQNSTFAKFLNNLIIRFGFFLLRDDDND